MAGSGVEGVAGAARSRRRGHGPPPESTAALDAASSVLASAGEQEKGVARPLLPRRMGQDPMRGSPEPRRGVLAKPAGRGACEKQSPEGAAF
jgi:hypothetical protein